VTHPGDGRPVIIQGGMGVGVSGWPLARAVATTGQMGVVSGVALDVLMARRLQRGDPGGHLRRALAHFPVPAVAARVLERHFVPGGADRGRPFRPVHRLGLLPRRAADELAVAANFAEVFLAKYGHDGPVGINYLEKMQLATPAAVYGAMLAGVDYVLMGAGLPTEIPALLDAFAARRPAELTITVDGAPTGERHSLRLDPVRLLGPDAPAPRRPAFLAIVSAAALVTYLVRDPATRPDGFVLEGPVAGGHSARPRGRLTLTADGEPVYGVRDALDLPKVRAAGLPFWLAGGQASPAALAAAQQAGAVGVQVGTAFALCRESGFDPALRRQLFDRAVDGTLEVRNRPDASPTGFPFKLAYLPGTASVDQVYADRPRLCDLGYLRTPYRRPDGRVGFRCPAEPVGEYVRKGGAVADTEGRRCLCNGLVATIGLGQHRPDGYLEPALVTLGQDLSFLPALRAAAGDDYTAADVVAYLLGASNNGVLR
jgi:NAD(P)H-dependent flavin oxidoreductase YrpB (nitropropane dioxygenase family)